MPVYVDQARNRFGRMVMCHMVADTLDELHAMAEAIGMRRAWFQGDRVPHYDVCLMRRAQALQLGAIEVDRRQLALVIRRVRGSTLDAAGGVDSMAAAQQERGANER